MGIKLGIVMDPVHRIHVHKDSTVAIMLAAQQRGHTLYHMCPDDLFTLDGQAYGPMAEIEVFADQDNWCRLSAPVVHPLTDLDCLLMRKDPPFNMAYIYCTYVLETAERAGLLVLNRPGSIRDCNEKYVATQFPQLCPPTLVAASKSQIRAFIDEHESCVIKPLDSMGGHNIFKIDKDSPNINATVDLLTEEGSLLCMVQRYIPEIIHGDRRVLMIMGKPVETMVARMPAPDDFRGNLSAGATAKVLPLGDKERAIAAVVGPMLAEKGLWFVGLDVIGGYLTEINVTSPTCIREIERESNTQVCEQLLDKLDELLT